MDYTEDKRVVSIEILDVKKKKFFVNAFQSSFDQIFLKFVTLAALPASGNPAKIVYPFPSSCIRCLYSL